MSSQQCDPLLQVETTCGSLLYELQIIWDEVGESDSERDRMLLELEQECLQVYRRKVDQANKGRAKLRQEIADAEAELATICAALGERPVHIRQADQSTGSLKAELRAILPELEEMRKRKSDRRKQFLGVLDEIGKVSNELYQSTKHISSCTAVDETDLSLRKLEDLHRQLQELQKEKSRRLEQVLDQLQALNSLCSVLGMNFNQTVSAVHPSLGDAEGTKKISNDTIEQLMILTKQLREVKIQRMQRLQDLATTMLELWNLMDTPFEEQQKFQNVTCNLAAVEHEITEPNMLSVDIINHVAAEVSRLEELKGSKMKELVLKKKTELEESCRKTHMVLDADSTMENAIEAIESGMIDPSCILEQFELQISKVKEMALARKEILERVERWIAACEEESWLDEYNRDDNRYNAGRGAHLTLKRAEKARSLVTKIPAMVETLASKVAAWEKERGIEFTYDGIGLVSMLEEYTILQQEREQERRRQRDQKKLQVQLIAEQEALFGSKRSPAKPQSGKKAPRVSTGGVNNKRLSLGGAMHQTPRQDPLHTAKATSHLRPAKKNDRLHQNDLLHRCHDDDFLTLSTGRRGLEATPLPTKPHSLGSSTAHELQSPMARVPFSPVMTNHLEDGKNNLHCETLHKVLENNNLPQTTPSKEAHPTGEENTTPHSKTTLAPATPMSGPVPMQMYMTPAPPPLVTSVSVAEVEEEYSFEERRAGFVVSKVQTKSAVQA